MRKAPIFTRLILPFVVSLGAVSTTMARTNPVCSSEMAGSSDSFISQSNVSWKELLQHWSTNKACDDGYFAEGYSEMVVHLLGYKWEKFSEFADVASTRPEFYSWVIRHIDESTPPDDLAKVRSNAASCRTDKKSARYCQAVSNAAEQALRRASSK